MPELPRVSGAEVIKALKRLGFEQVRQSGSHVMMRRNTKGCVVSLHADIRVAPWPACFVKPMFPTISSCVLSDRLNSAHPAGVGA